MSRPPRPYSPRPRPRTLASSAVPGAVVLAYVAFAIAVFWGWA